MPRKPRALSEQHDRIDALAADVERSNDELAEIEGELRYVETELESVRERCDDLRARAANRDSLRDELEELSVEIERLRTRKDDIKRHTREAFAVQGRVPVLLMDRLGGLNDSNFHALIQSLRGRAEYLVFTAYPEHAAFDGHDIDPGDWVVVSDDGQPAKA